MTTDGQALATDDLTATYERDRYALYRYCRSIVRHEDDAQDALQSAMTRAVAAAERPRGDDLRPWLFRIAHNESVSILRRRRPVVELDAEIPALGAVHERVEQRQTLRLLRQDLADLPERQRTALVLRELNGLRPTEIAVLLETTPGAIKQTILEARRALSKCDEGRATPCFEVQRTLSDGDGRALRRRGLRAHLRSCASCRRFNADLGRRPAELKALAPPLPAGLGAALLGWLQGSAAGGALTKAAVGVAVMTAAATGAHTLEHGRPAHPAITRHAAGAAAMRPQAVALGAAIVPGHAAATAPGAGRERAAAAPAHGAGGRRHAGTAPGRRGAARDRSEAARGHAGAAPGKSGAAPGHAGTAPGKSGAAPGHAGTAPGHAGTAPGHAGTAPGHAGTAPGHAGTAPGHAGTAPGHAGTAPGHAGTAPGHAGTAPGHAGTAPGHTGTAPGHTGTAPGHTGAAPGKSDASSGNSGAAPGKSGSAPGHAERAAADSAPAPTTTPRAATPAAHGDSGDAPGHLKEG